MATSFQDYKQAGKYISASDIPNPMVATIARFETKQEQKYRSNETEQRLVVYFGEFGNDRYMKLTNTQLDDLGSMFGTMENAINKQVVLMTTNVEVGGQQRQTVKISPHLAGQAVAPAPVNEANPFPAGPAEPVVNYQ